MKKLTTRIICVALTLILVLCTNGACGFIEFNTGDGEQTSGDTTAPPTDTTSPSTQPVTDTPKTTPGDAARERLSSLHDKGLGSTPIIIATVDESVVCPMNDSDSPGVAARIDVRRAVEEKYGATVISITADPDTLYNDALEAYNSGMYYADLIAIPQSLLGKFCAAGILANMNSLPHADYTAPYYDQGIISASTVGSGVYAVSGAVNFDPYSLGCVYFNKTLASECGIEDLYSLVFAGNWTWDKLGELAKSVSQSAVFGHASSFETTKYIDLAASSCGITYTSNDFGEVPTVDFTQNASADRAKDAVELFRELIGKDGGYLDTSGADARDAFLDGSVLFLTDSLSFAKTAANANLEWGIIPLPKFNSKQKNYISVRLDDAVVFCALKNTPNYETSGLILEAMNAAAHDYVPTATKREIIDFCLRDSDSIKMLDIICEGAYADFAHLFASGANKLAEATYDAVTKAATTKYNADVYTKNNRSAANRALTSIVGKYE